MSTARAQHHERTPSHARAAARRIALQALYRWQLNHGEWQELIQEFAADAQGLKADTGYLQTLLHDILATQPALDEALAPLLDRPPGELDPIEHAALLIGSYELRQRPEIPWRVAISEAVGLARRFGATDGHKLVNAVLDRGARLWRGEEVR